MNGPLSRLYVTKFILHQILFYTFHPFLLCANFFFRELKGKLTIKISVDGKAEQHTKFRCIVGYEDLLVS